MASIEFDLIKLEQSGDIDVKNAVKNFPGYEEYFKQLLKFTGESERYLRKYAPETVVSEERARIEFIDELKSIRATLAELRITGLLPVITELYREANVKNALSFSTCLSKFYMQLDYIVKNILQAEIKSESPEKKTEPAQSTDKPVILAVDDKPELLTVVVNMLNNRFKVMAVTSGKAVLKVLEKHTPELFLLDIEMPGMDGYELAMHIRKNKRFEKTPILFLTSKNSRDSVVEAIRHGGNDYILKPVNKDLLLSKVSLHLGIT